MQDVLKGKQMFLQKITFRCLWILAFWYNLQDVKVEYIMPQFIDSLHE